MSEITKQILTEMNRSLHEKLQSEFVNYLQSIELTNLVEIAKKINWELAVKSFELEYKKVWNNLAVPKMAKDMDLKKEFERVLLVSIKGGLFYSVCLILKDKIKESNTNEEEITRVIDDYFKYNMYEYFRVFDYQFTLSTLSKINDAHLISKKIEDLRKRSEFTIKVSGVNPIVDYEKVFKLIDKELERRERIGQRWSIKAACEYYARNELGIEPAAGHQFALDNFHKKYLEHRKKNNLDN
jgi:hypothetical protein